MPQPRPSVLEIETYDVRPLSRLLRGIAFQQRAVVTLSIAGLAFQVEDTRAMVAVAYVSKALFDEFSFTPLKITRNKRPRRAGPSNTNSNPFTDAPQTPSRRGTMQPRLPGSGFDDSDSDSEEGMEEDDPKSFQFEVNLLNLSECLNIYGHANPISGSSNSGSNSTGDDFGAGAGRTGKKRFGPEETGNVGGMMGGGNPNGCTSLLMKWAGPGWPLLLTLRDDEPNTPMTTCELTLLEPEESNEEQFNQDQMLFHVIMKATWLKEAINDLDPSCDKITIIAGPPLPEEERLREERRDQDRPNGKHGERKARERAGIFRLKAKGDFGMTELDYPNDRDVMDVFICSEPLSFSYDFRLFSQANRALQSAIKVSLRIDEEGFLSLQMMMPAPAGKRLENSSDSGIIEFKLQALDDQV